MIQIAQFDCTCLLAPPFCWTKFPKKNSPNLKRSFRNFPRNLLRNLPRNSLRHFPRFPGRSKSLTPNFTRFSTSEISISNRIPNQISPKNHKTHTSAGLAALIVWVLFRLYRKTRTQTPTKSKVVKQMLLGWPMESQTRSSKRPPRELQSWRVQGNASPTLCQPFANLSPTLCQPFLPTPLQAILSVDPRRRFRNAG